MRAILYCVMFRSSDIAESISKVFVMPCDALSLQHISSPCASIDSELSEKICYAIANNLREFQLGDENCYIISYSVFDQRHIEKYREPRISDIFLREGIVTPLHVYSGRPICVNEKHQIETIRANVRNLNNEDICSISVFYCLKCNKYWLYRDLLNNYNKNNIYPAVRYRHYDVYFEGDYYLRKKSDLKMYGYDTSFSDGVRQQKLLRLIKHGLLSPMEIIAHLEFCINVPGRQPHMMESVQKWKMDKAFVLNIPPDLDIIVDGYVKL